MKYILQLIFAFFYFESSAQDCKDYVSVKSDKVTGKETFSFNEIITISDDGGKTGLLLHGLLDSKKKSAIVIFIGADESFSCVSEGDKIYVLFRDESRLQLQSDGDFNCQGKFTVYFGGIFGKKKQLEELSKKEIDVVRLTTRTGSVEKTLTPEQSKQYMQSISCLLASMK